MDLINKNRDKLDFKNLRFNDVKFPHIVILICILLFFYFVFNTFSNFKKIEILKNNNLTYLSLLNDKKNIEKKLKNLKFDNAEYFKMLKNSPKTKTKFSSEISNLASKAELKIIKIISKNLPGNRTNPVVDFEFEGSYYSITLFLNFLDEITPASEIESLILSKKNSTNMISLKLKVKYGIPPSLNESSNLNTYLDLGDLNSFLSDHRKAKVYLTQNYSSNNEIQNIAQSFKNSENKKFRDPFKPLNKNIIVKKKGLKKNQMVDEFENISTEKKNKLVGVIYSESKTFCVVEFKNGYLKIFNEGQKFTENSVIKKITNESITLLTTVKDKNFLKVIIVGEEFP